MTETRIPLSLYIDAHLRQLNAEGRGYYIVNKGAFDGGGFVLKISLLDGFCHVLTQIRDEKGDLGWMNATKDETIAEMDADAYIHRAVSRDPDMWVIEIEDRNGKNPFEGKVIL